MASICLSLIMFICIAGAFVFLLFGLLAAIGTDYFVLLGDKKCKNSSCKPFKEGKHMLMAEYFVTVGLEILIAILIYFLNRDKPVEQFNKPRTVGSLIGVQLVNEQISKEPSKSKTKSINPSLLEEEEIQ